LPPIYILICLIESADEGLDPHPHYANF